MDKPKQYLDRLAALNRGSLRHQGEVESEIAAIRRKLHKQRVEQPSEGRSAPQPILHRRDAPISRQKAPPPRRIYTKHVSLGEVVEGVELSTRCGRALLIEKRAWEIADDCAGVCEEFRACLAGSSRVGLRVAEIAGVAAARPDDLLFLDIETTGLSAVPLFLIGTMTWEDGGLVVRQYLARDYSEEAAVTALFMEAASGKTVLTSFNGKSFDLPFIRLRAAANAVPCRLPPSHYDLLHEARRIWRGVLPDCKLQTLERHICGRSRSFDIPGSEIPEAYHAFVRDGNAAEIVRILEHNALDLVTMADLMTRMG